MSGEDTNAVEIGDQPCLAHHTLDPAKLGTKRELRRAHLERESTIETKALLEY